MSTFGAFTVTRASTKNVLGSAGTYVSVANNTPAFEFNTDGTYRGLLVEPGATNLLTYSAQFDDASWSKTDITVTANSIASPDGTTTADTLTEGTAGTAVLTKAVAVSAGATATASIYLKIGSENTFVRVMLGNDVSFGDRVQTWINLSTGALGNTGNLGTGTGASASVLALPNGWYRVSISGAIPTATSYRLYVNSASASGSATRVSNSVYYLWQAQIETGSVATSPIVTTGSTAARVADAISLTSASSLIGQAEGTLYLEAELPAYNIGGTSSCLFGINVNGSSDILQNGIFLGCVATQVNQPRFIVSSGGVNTTAISMSTNRPAGIYKFAGAYASNDAAFYANGAQIGTDNTVTVGSNAEVYINYSPVTNRPQVAWIRSVALFPTRLANATLASLTT